MSKLSYASTSGASFHYNCINIQSLNNVINTPSERLAIVLLKSCYTSSVTRDSSACPRCVIPFFVDTAWSVREFVRYCHTQLAHAHGRFCIPSKCVIRNDTYRSFFVDSHSGNALLQMSDNLLTCNVDQVNRYVIQAQVTADGSHSSANGDKLYESKLSSVLAQKYLTATHLGDPSALEAIMTEVAGSRHVSECCARSIHDNRLYNSCAQRCNTKKLYPVAEFATSCALMCGAYAHAENCRCVFESTLRRASTLLRIDVVPPPYDEVSEQFGERLLNTESPMVCRYLERLGQETRGAGGELPIILHMKLDVRARNTVPLSFDPYLVRPVTFNHVPYDHMRTTICSNDSSTTICQHLVKTRQFNDVNILRDAMTWVSEPALHFVKAAVSGFTDYVKRLNAMYRAGGNQLLTVECERAVYEELVREPNRVMAVNRVLTCESRAVSMLTANQYTAKLHDDVVVYAMCVIHMIWAAEWAITTATRELSSLPVDPWTRFATLVEVACRERKTRTDNGGERKVLLWNDVTFQ